jgi:minor extracellular serine protease Vpr
MPARFRFLFAVFVLFVGFVPGSRAQSGGARRFVQAPASGEFVPAIQLGHRPEMTVVLKMAGDPVAVVRSRAPGKHIAEADRKVIENALRTQQEALIPEIEAQGATVLATFQHAINGIKVRATADQIASLARLPGVVAVKPVLTYKMDNATSVPFIGTPAVWQGPPGLHGEKVKVAVIDTGVDFTHANFGGPATPAAYKAAFATDTLPADPAFFGPNAPKVKGGTDLVGDAYNADDPTSVPKPDPNPLDCAGHGSHVSGTVAGFGVLSDGTTFKGPYDATTPSHHFTIGPGVAPLADLYMVKVFGCVGSTNVVVEAFDWVVANDMDVVNLSLGSPFGAENTADAEAAENAVNAGVIVVASAGNSGFAPYITGSPASGDKVVSAAAMDRTASFPGVTLALSTGKSIVAQNSNIATFTDGTSLPVFVLPDKKGSGAAGVSLGCDPTEYTAAGVNGKLVVVQRGFCARVAKAIYGQQAGAAAVAMINNATGFPPIEGQITSNPDTGMSYTVTIPFLGVKAHRPLPAMALH